jgi:hypothetical protein
MSEYTILLVWFCALLFMFGLVLGIALGRWYEKREWNGLIARGDIPAPGEGWYSEKDVERMKHEQLSVPTFLRKDS